MVSEDRPLQSADRAVSEVLGVVFMVGITVIIAAIVGVFALGLGQQAATTEPPVAIGVESVDASANTIVLEQNGGDAIAFDQISIKVSNESGSSFTFPASAGSSATFSPADQITITTTGPSITHDGGAPYSSHEGSSFELNSGDRVTVTVIDKDAGTIIAERTIIV